MFALLKISFLARRNIMAQFAVKAVPTLRELSMLKQKIDALDLGPIKYKLIHPEEGNPWSLEQCNQMEPLYKGWL
ncbi:hypothetical protein KC711_08035 [Candidatus Peregrinibacteria bacterium]|nr:hypothetical protein [Candidatus Peregrinibacteria bacterium]